jgi:Bax protein
MTKNQKILLLTLLLCGTFLISACERSAFSWPAPETATIATITPTNHRELSNYLTVNDYRWETLDQGVPPFLLTALPKDIQRIKDITERKRLFFLSLLPSVLLANREITLQRQQLLIALRHHQAGLPLSIPQQQLLSRLIKDYRLRNNPLTDLNARKALLQRLDTLPPDLVLAQAANESGYGTSRFCRLGNNLFGQWTYATGTGLVPKERSAKQRHEVQRFATLYDSVRSYMNNLNAHRAYRSLRTIRAQKRTRGQALRGIDLAAGLRLYSSRRDAYVAEIRAIIRSNRLSRLATVSLRPAAAEADALRTASL